MIIRIGDRSRLTVWDEGADPLGIPPGTTGVEFRGKLGHPSSYGLLAGRPVAPGAPASIALLTPPPDEHLEVPIDDVPLGLPDEYRPAVLAAAENRRFPIEITHAVHGVYGSSWAVFYALPWLLIDVLRAPPTSSSEDELWQRWFEARPSADEATRPA